METAGEAAITDTELRLWLRADEPPYPDAGRLTSEQVNEVLPVVVAIATIETEHAASVAVAMAGRSGRPGALTAIVEATMRDDLPHLCIAGAFAARHFIEAGLRLPEPSAAWTDAIGVACRAVVQLREYEQSAEVAAVARGICGRLPADLVAAAEKAAPIYMTNQQVEALTRADEPLYALAELINPEQVGQILQGIITDAEDDDSATYGATVAVTLAGFTGYDVATHVIAAALESPSADLQVAAADAVVDFVWTRLQQDDITPTSDTIARIAREDVAVIPLVERLQAMVADEQVDSDDGINGVGVVVSAALHELGMSPANGNGNGRPAAS